MEHRETKLPKLRPIATLVLAATALLVALTGCTSTPGTDSPDATPSSTSQMSGWPFKALRCPNPQILVQGERLRDDPEPVSGTVQEYLFCRQDWYSTAPPDRHLDTTNQDLLDRVTAALSTGDVSPKPTVTCSDRENLQADPPVLVRTTSGIWLVDSPLVPCSTALHPLESELAQLD